MTQRILVVGKQGAIVHLLENMVAGFSDAGCEVQGFAVNGADWRQRLILKSLHLAGNRLAADRLVRQFGQIVERLRPQLVFFIFPYYYPPYELFAVARASRHAPLLAGWVGDRFKPEDIAVARHLDRVYYTDSEFIEEARQWGFPDHNRYLPLAADQRHFHALDLPRRPEMVFVANITGHREAVVASIRKPIVVWGRHWDRMQGTPHEIHPRRLPQSRLPGIYASHRAVLNVRNECNVLAGINQRTFEPLACKTPVLNDAMPDLERCFEPGREILVYRDQDELNAQYERLLADERLARTIGEAGWKRVMAEHTYGHRARTILDDLGLA